MYIQLLKNQHITFVSDVQQAEECSPFYIHYSLTSGLYLVKNQENDNHCVAAGLSKEEAEACVMFKANEYLFRKTR